MKNLLLMVIAVMTGVSAFAQSSIDDVLASVEQNNTALKALKADIEAQKLENRTGIYLPNPEVEFNYLWGNPNNIGNRNDISVRQTFDFATVTGMKRKMSDRRNGLLELQYKAERLDVLRRTKQYCLSLIYYNALKRELDLRLEHAETLAGGYKNRLDNGDANILEYNKVRLNLATVKGEMANVEIERKSILSELKRLNGGVDVSVNESEYQAAVLPDNFDGWFALAEQKNPVLEYVKQEVEIAKNQVSLNRAMSLPNISAGFMREKVVGEAYQGISVGISIPLMENKNRVKQAKAAVRATEAKQTDSKVQFCEYLKNLYERAKGLQVTANEYRESLSSLNSAGLLKKALDAGEISLLDYIVEIGLYYNAVNLKLEAERQFQEAFAELMATVTI
ncbi:MAG: TolC family protein [Prevotellaceae bacterium]|jgi:outer membrane protein TolC|nr:TolC family protein [Prevotellaceae bacterium]